MDRMAFFEMALSGATAGAATWAEWKILDAAFKTITTLGSYFTVDNGVRVYSRSRDLAFELFLSSKVLRTEVICPSDWAARPPDIEMPNGTRTYGHEYEVLRSIVGMFRDEPTTWEGKNESWLAHVDSSQIMLASGSSNLASAEVIGTPQNPKFALKIGKHRINLAYSIGAGTGRLKRLQYGREVSVNANTLCTVSGRIVQAAAQNGYQVDDYLLVTRTPGAMPHTVLTVLSGLHGPGTRSAEMLFNSIPAEELKKLTRRIDHKPGKVPYFQAVFRASGFVESNGSSVPTKIELHDEGCPPIRLTT